VVLFVVILGLAFYMGMFSQVSVTAKKTGPYTLVYEEFTGNYKNTGPVFEKIFKEAESQGIDSPKMFGVYFDDPAQVQAADLRSFCGVLIEQKDADKLPELEKKYKVMKIPEAERMTVEFPVKNMLSYMIGPMKAYPAIAKYAKEKGCEEASAGYELYDMDGKKIVYMMDTGK
jgi:hypothetical protein